MTGRNNLDELLDVLEGIRQAKYPHIPSEVIRAIVLAQYDFQDQRSVARNTTHKIVNDFLNDTVAKEG